MSPVKGWKSRLFWIAVGAVLLLVMWGVVTRGSDYAAHAQDEVSNIKLHLEKLRSEMEAGNLMIGFQFIEPIQDDRDYWLFGDNSSDNVLGFVSIEDDHFCFSQSSRQSVLIRCVPYTNIASFDYLST